MHFALLATILLLITVESRELLANFGKIASGQSLTSSDSVVKKPGESVTLSCTGSGFSVGSSYMHWVYQKPGNGLEWIGRIDPGTGTIFAQSLQGQFSIKKDSSKNMLYLEIKSLKTEDTAVYYCAGESQSHKRLGTKVTVTNGKEPKRPSVYILAPPEHKEGDKMTLTCYVKDFYPKEVFVSWLADDEPVTLGYSYNTSLPIHNDKYFSVYSQLTVDHSEWKSGTVFSCIVYHESIDEKMRVLTRSIDDNIDKAGVINLSMTTPASCKD
uniref:Ig-like domain-containing protein n=1 Tax=Cyprinus carpio TaxID=7962 RepID=A0A8C1JQP9_CYPCA